MYLLKPTSKACELCRYLVVDIVYQLEFIAAVVFVIVHTL